MLLLILSLLLLLLLLLTAVDAAATAVAAVAVAAAASSVVVDADHCEKGTQARDIRHKSICSLSRHRRRCQTYTLGVLQEISFGLTSEFRLNVRRYTLHQSHDDPTPTQEVPNSSRVTFRVRPGRLRTTNVDRRGRSRSMRTQPGHFNFVWELSEKFDLVVAPFGAENTIIK